MQTHENTEPPEAAKYYNVWVEVEEHDTESDTYETVDLVDGAGVACFTDIDEAMAFANALQAAGEAFGNLKGSAQ